MNRARVGAGAGVASLTGLFALFGGWPAALVFVVQGDIAVRKKSDSLGLPPREAWNMECVQQDTLNPKPCSEADRLVRRARRRERR